MTKKQVDEVKGHFDKQTAEVRGLFVELKGHFDERTTEVKEHFDK